jgi:ATP-dependent DNA helicase DinG
MERIFGPSGLLAQKLNSYEYRPEQRQMAQAVNRAFTQERFLIVEAGTGTGKTLAYLVPAVLAGKRVIISTGTKTLQEQLFFRDVPFIQRKLGFPFKASFMKGRTNYLCHRRLRLFSRQPLFSALEEMAHYRILKKWAGRTKTGDRAELEELPEDLGLWKEVCASSETCLGQGCEFFDCCFITRMRQEAAGSDVVVVNHHLFFADLAVRLKGFGEVLPRYEVVIFDEAHQLEEVATQYFGTAISNFRFEELARDVRREMAATKVKDEALNKTSGELLDGQEQFFGLFRAGESCFRLREGHLPGGVQESAAKLFAALTFLSAHIEGMKDPPEGLRTVGRRAEEMKRQLQEVLGLSDTRRVYWCEVRGRGVFLQASPVDVSSELKGHLYSRLKTAVFTSATLSAQGNFRFFKERLGLEGTLADVTDELLLDSSFDMESQALLYLPENLPDPNHPTFVVRAAEEIEKILADTRGRAFVLFTSIRNMEEAYGLLKGRLPFTCFVQGERPRSALIQAFKEDIHSVLFATASFWEGVDVQGEALSCVIVDRLPFSRPNEPILQARLERIAYCGGSPFWDYQVPSAIILLKQGLGRLIRTRQDRGLLAILDPRILRKSYGKAFLESLPRCHWVHDRGVIGPFLSEGRRIVDYRRSKYYNLLTDEL